MRPGRSVSQPRAGSRPRWIKSPGSPWARHPPTSNQGKATQALQNGWLVLGARGARPRSSDTLEVAPPSWESRGPAVGARWAGVLAGPHHDSQWLQWLCSP